MPKLFLRICVVVLAASFALALAPVASHAKALTAGPAKPPAYVSWLDAARASLGEVFPVLPAVGPRSVGPIHDGAKAHHRGWLRPTCQSQIGPDGHCL